MARDTKARIAANTLQVEVDILEAKVEALQDRLESVADILIKHGFLNNTPYDRYRFVNGDSTNHFSKVNSEYIDLDNEKSEQVA